jgi:hypothetical protein
MILKIKINDEQEEAFEITNFYKALDRFEDGDILPYLEADIEAGENGARGVGQRQIILDANNYLDETDEWAEISIITDSGLELLKIKNNNLVG